MIGPGIKVKQFYFDRSIIKTRWNEINETPLKKAGLLIRKIARGSIRRTKTNRPSRPGTPPRSRSSRGEFKMIYSLPTHWGTGVIVGMVGFRIGQHPVPGRHEHGDMLTTEAVAPLIRKRKKKTKLTKRQWEWLQKNKQRPRQRKTIRYSPRPFMIPALKKAQHVLPTLWARSISY